LAGFIIDYGKLFFFFSFIETGLDPRKGLHKNSSRGFNHQRCLKKMRLLLGNHSATLRIGALFFYCNTRASPSPTAIFFFTTSHLVGPYFFFLVFLLPLPHTTNTEKQYY